MFQVRMTKNGESVKELNLNSGREYLVGRSEECDIVLGGEKGISRQHFKIFEKDGSWNVEVLSRFGEMYLQGNKIHSLTLIPGVKIEVPPYAFDFLGVDKVPESSKATPTSEDVENESPQVDIPEEDFGDRTVILNLSSIAYIRILDGAGGVTQMFRLEGDQWVAGREASSSILIDDSRVSRKHFEIVRKETAYFIRDLGSINGTHLNNEPLEPGLLTPLRSGDQIRITDLKMIFELHDAEFTDKLQRAAPISNQPVLFDNLSEQNESFESPSELKSNSDSGFASDLHSNYGGQNINIGFQGIPQGVPISQSVFVEPSKFVPHEEEKVPRTNWLRVILLFAILGGGAWFYLFEMDPVEPKKVETNIPKSPFEKLSPDERSLVTQSVNMARLLREQNSFQMCLAKLGVVHKLLPLGHDGSLQLQSDCQAGELAELERQKQEDELKKAEELRIKVQGLISNCEKLLSPNVKANDMDFCLMEAITLDPENAAVASLQMKAKEFERVRLEKERQRAILNSEFRKLQSIYNKAKTLDSAGVVFEAIDTYDLVIASNLVDYGGLKEKAKNDLAALNLKISQQQSVYIKEANDAQAKGEFKAAIVALEKAMKLVRKSPELKERHEQMMNELRKLMQPIYQEAILEESVGDVDSAKAKWRSIMASSLPAEEYFQKARIKLRKYGPL